jgi:hypothetical protein
MNDEICNEKYSTNALVGTIVCCCLLYYRMSAMMMCCILQLPRKQNSFDVSGFPHLHISLTPKVNGPHYSRSTEMGVSKIDYNSMCHKKK